MAESRVQKMILGLRILDDRISALHCSISHDPLCRFLLTLIPCEDFSVASHLVCSLDQGVIRDDVWVERDFHYFFTEKKSGRGAHNPAERAELRFAGPETAMANTASSVPCVVA